MAKTLNLTEQELQKLIIETYLEITDKNFVLNALKKSKIKNWKKLDEQAEMGPDGMMYLDPNQSMSANMEEVSRLQKEMDAATTYARKKYSDGIDAIESGDDAWYNDKHIWLDILAAILYIAGALTVEIYGLGVILMGAAIITDLYNAHLYYVEEDYFMCGLTASFVIIPGINLAYVKGLFGAPLKALAKVANKAFSSGISVSLKELTEALGSKTVASITRVVKKYPFILDSFRKASRWIDDMIDAFTSFIKWLDKNNRGWKDWIIPDWVINSIKAVRQVLRVVKETIKLGIYILLEMSIYDPDFPGSLLDILGFEKFADWLHAQPKLLLSFHNWILDEMGNKKAVMTTTPYDCKRSVYKWDEIVTEFSGKFSPSGEPTEDMIWEEWVKGWRPGGGSMASVIFTVMSETPAVVKEYPSYFKDCYKFTKLYDSANSGNNDTDKELLAEITAFWKENR